jgi:hypothetical protein
MLIKYFFEMFFSGRTDTRLTEKYSSEPHKNFLKIFRFSTF